MTPTTTASALAIRAKSRVASSLAHNPSNMPPIASSSARNPTSCRTMSHGAHNRTKDPKICAHNPSNMHRLRGDPLAILSYRRLGLDGFEGKLQRKELCTTKTKRKKDPRDRDGRTARRHHTGRSVAKRKNKRGRAGPNSHGHAVTHAWTPLAPDLPHPLTSALYTQLWYNIACCSSITPPRFTMPAPTATRTLCTGRGPDNV